MHGNVVSHLGFASSRVDIFKWTFGASNQRRLLTHSLVLSSSVPTKKADGEDQAQKKDARSWVTVWREREVFSQVFIIKSEVPLGCDGRSSSPGNVRVSMDLPVLWESS